MTCMKLDVHYYLQYYVSENVNVTKTWTAVRKWKIHNRMNRIFNKSGGGQTVALSRHQHDAYLRQARAARNERMNVPVKSINNNH